MNSHFLFECVVKWSVSENWKNDPFWVHVYGLRYLNLKISTYRDALNGLFSEIFWLRKEKKNDYPLYKDFAQYLRLFIKKDKNRDEKTKLRGTSFCHLSLIKTMIFIPNFYLKNGRLYEDEVNIKIAFLLGEYKHLNYFTDGFLRYIYYSIC